MAGKGSDMGQIKDILRTMEYGPAPESNTDVRNWLETHATGFGHFINGKFTGVDGHKTFAVINPRPRMSMPP
jgi:aldehyde dehydrogenase (NAD+)